MKNLVSAALLAATAVIVAAPATLHAAEAAREIKTGQSLYDADGKRVAAVYRVAQDGAVQVILDGRLVSVPAATLSVVEGKVVTTMSRTEIRRALR